MDQRQPVWQDVPDGTVWKIWEEDLSTFINVQGPEYSPDLPDKEDQPKEEQQSWIQYTKDIGVFPWSYDPDDGESKIWTNPNKSDGGAAQMCNRVACGRDGLQYNVEGCSNFHTDCKCCKDHTDIGAYCEAGIFQLYDKDYWVPTYDRGLCSVYSGPACFPGSTYCPCIY